MAFKLQFADNSQHPEQESARVASFDAKLDRTGNAEEVINPPSSDESTSREAHVDVVSTKGSGSDNPPKRNNRDGNHQASPAKEPVKPDRMKGGSRERKVGSSVEPMRFTVLNIASLPMREFIAAVREFERGVGVHNTDVRLMLSHGMFEDLAVSGSISDAKMGEYRDRIIRAYFLYQFNYLKDYGAVDSMTDLDPSGKYRKPVRSYHVYYDLFDYLREHASALTDCQYVLKTACKAAMSYYKCIADEDGHVSATVDIKDQKGGKLGDSPKAVAKFQATIKLCYKIANGGAIDATTFYDLANRMRLFCPGFAPKDWRSSVK